MGQQITAIPMKQTINCRGKLINFSTPQVMGIINVTPDSFFDGGRYNTESGIIERAKMHLDAGASILDLGAVSTRPKAEMIAESEELHRLIPAIKLLRSNFPDTVISVDTFRAHVAELAVDAGADMINDISGGTMDEKMFETIAKLQVPYVLMHIQGTPETMQDNPSYEHVTKDVITDLMLKVEQLKKLGVHDLIIDPGFGFGKTAEHNYRLLRNLNQFAVLGHPILVGLSRKSMINKVLSTKPENALNGTTALNMIALEHGASILRVHDAKEAMECVKLHTALYNSNSNFGAS